MIRRVKGCGEGGEMMMRRSEKVMQRKGEMTMGEMTMKGK